MKGKWLFTCLIVLLVFTGMTNSASADLYSGKKKNVTTSAWYHESVSQYGYTSYYDEARTYWNKMGSNAFVGKKTSGNLQRGEDDQYYVNSLHPTFEYGYFGQMQGYKKTLLGHEPTVLNGNWEYAVVVVYDEAMRAVTRLRVEGESTAVYSRSSAIYNMAHEIGHSLKFNHPTHTKQTVMTSGLHTMPTSAYNQDKYELNYKWGSR